MQVTAISMLYDAGNNEDGRAYYAERFVVQVENADGRRWEHFLTYPGARRVEEDDTVYFEDIRSEARAKAEHLANRIRAHLAMNCTLDFTYWQEVRPAYGSKAYQELDAAGFFYQEELEDDRHAA